MKDKRFPFRLFSDSSAWGIMEEALPDGMAHKSIVELHKENVHLGGKMTGGLIYDNARKRKEAYYFICNIFERDI